MTKIAVSLTAALCVVVAPLLAGTTAAGKETLSTSSALEETRSTFPFEFTLEGSWVGEGAVDRTSRLLGVPGVTINRRIRFEEIHTAATAIYTPRTAIGILRLGVRWERYSFDLPDLIRPTVVSLPPPPPPPVIPLPIGIPTTPPQIPDTLQSLSAIIGLDTQLGEAWLVRLELQPGFYGTDDLGSHTFNMPIVVGGTYIHSSELQFVLGVSVDWERNYPVFPGGGIRWRFAPQWLLDLTAPSPRLSYEVTQNLTVYAGGHIQGGSYRVSRDFGRRGLLDEELPLNKAVLTYLETRVGAGIEWKITPEVRLTLEGGYMPYREFDYHRTEGAIVRGQRTQRVRYRHDEGAPYGMVSLRAAF
jgi:hypothetical protein